MYGSSAAGRRRVRAERLKEENGDESGSGVVDAGIGASASGSGLA